MITENNVKRLDNLVAKYSMQDYLSSRKNLRRKGNGYALSQRTEEAREMLHLARKENITRQEEEAVKEYLLKQKLLGMED